MALNSTSVSGLQVDDYRFTTIVNFAWLLDNTIGGETLEATIQEDQDRQNGKIGEGVYIDKRTLHLAQIRAKMQRPFKVNSMIAKSVKGNRIMVPTLKPTAKYRNAYGPLKDYLVEKFAASPHGSFGVLPAFVILWPETLPDSQLETPDSVFGGASWRAYDFAEAQRAVLVDGESRIAAAAAVRNDPTVPHTIKDQLMQQLVTVEAFHGLDAERAAQAFIDLNFEGVKVDNITRANIDPRNKWVKVTKDIFDEIDIKLATNGRQITAAHVEMGEMLLLTHGIQMVKAITMGAGAVTNKASGEKSWRGVNFDKLRAAGVTWFREIFNHFGGASVLTDKSRVIRSIPVRVALASLGEAHYLDDSARQNTASDLLSEVDWTVSLAWNGLGGKVIEDDDGNVKMASGSGKELCTAVISALANPKSAIRRKSQ